MSTQLLRICFPLVLLLALPAQAVQVTKIQGQTVTISIDKGAPKPGDLFEAYDALGMKKAQIRITKVKGNQAQGEIEKGTLREGDRIFPSKVPPTTKPTFVKKIPPPSGNVKSEIDQMAIQDAASKPEPLPVTEPPPKRSAWALGGFLGYTFDSLKVAFSSETVSASGTGFSAQLAADYYIRPFFTIRSLLGMETFYAKGLASTNICGDDNTTDCSTKITYITADLWARYSFITKPVTLWLGLGFGLHFPSSKSTNILKPDSITSASLFYIGTGSDIPLSSSLYLSVQVDYGYFLKSVDVTAYTVALRGGLLYRF